MNKIVIYIFKFLCYKITMAGEEKNICLLCSSDKLEQYPAKFAEFISKRVFNGNNKEFKLCRCKDCGFAFYSYRFTENENCQLYKNYRNEDYQKLRQSCESWYTEQVNFALGNDKSEIIGRRKMLLNILKKYIPNISDINTILDFGGDRGQLVADLLQNTKSYVYEISEPEVENNVSLISDWKDSKITKFDLIICAQVMEHVSNPIKVLQIMKDHLADNGYLYIDVPYYSPFNNSNPLDNIRYKLNKIFKLNKLKIYNMHEHINFFTIKSLANMLINNNFSILYSGVNTIHSDFRTIKIISVLAKVKN